MSELHDNHSKEGSGAKAKRAVDVKIVGALGIVSGVVAGAGYESRHFLGGVVRLFRDHPEEALVANGALLSLVAIPMAIRSFYYELPRWRRASASVAGILSLTGGLLLLSKKETQTEKQPSLSTSTTILGQPPESSCELVFPVLETDSGQVMKIQASLPDAGPLDGRPGSRTKGAINNLAANNGIVLPAGVLIDEAICALIPELNDGDLNTPILP